MLLLSQERNEHRGTGMLKKLQTIRFSLCALLVLFSDSHAASLKGSEVPTYSIDSPSTHETVIRVRFPEIEIEEMDLDGQRFGKIRMEGTGWTVEPGKAELPAFSRLVAVPGGAAVEVSIQDSTYSILKGIRLWPSLETEAKKTTESRPTLENSLSLQDVFYPEGVVETGPAIQLRDQRMVPLTLYPALYNPYREELKVLHSITVTLTHAAGPSSGRGFGQTEIKSEAFEKLYRSMVADGAPVLSWQDVRRGGYLIITPDQYVEALEPLAEWKRQKGHRTEVVPLSQIGPHPDNTQIREYILDYYTHSDVPLEYVILAGDADDVPTFFYYDEMEEPYSPLGPWDAADHPYSLLEGGDYFSDVFVGRLSVSSINEMHTVVNKIVSYERDPYMGQTSWYKKALMVCNYGGIASARTTKLWIRDKLLENGYTDVDTSFTFDMLACDAGFISSAIHSGVSLINYRGELDWGGWTSPDDYDNIDALNNGFMLPVVTDMVCRATAFYFDCPAEAWLRAGSVTTPRGAVAVVGPTAINTRGYFNNVMDAGFYAGLFDDSLSTVGQALARAKTELYTQYPLNRGPGHAHNSVECYFYIYTVIGDPGLEMWTDIPHALIVTAPSSIVPGPTQLNLWVHDTGQRPVGGAYACLTGEGQIHAGGFTGTDGRIDLPLSLEAGDSVTVTVTRQNFKPFQQTIHCQQSPIRLSLADHLIDDDPVGQSQGDGDGAPNPGETIELTLSLRNGGSSQTAASVSAELTCSDPYVSIVEGTSPFGNIPPGQSAWGQEDYLFTVSPDCPDGHRVTLYVEITGEDDSGWNSSLQFSIEAPAFTVQALQVNDGDQPLPDGVLDPGETVQLTVTLTNTGSKTGTDMRAILMTTDQKISVLEATSDFGTITAGSQGDNSETPFHLSAFPTIEIGRQVQFTLLLESWPGMTDTASLSLSVGTPSSSAPTGPDSYGYSAYDNTDWRSCERPSYAWIEIDPAHGGSGTVLNLVDEPEPPPAPPWYYVPYYPQGETEVLPLPFSFPFYGKAYDRISVCSNGWISMDSTWMTNFRNWSLPAVLSPPGLIAPFWDDLYMGDGCVAYWYDEQGHRFIVEWSRVHNDYDDALETFQVILHDPLQYPTVSGDGEILFQYQTIDNCDYARNFATIGIESPDKQSAVEYTYAGHYSPGAERLTDGLAIKFSTGQSLPSGPFLSLFDLSLDEDGLDMSWGDGDGRIESGERCELQICLQNIGDAPAAQIRGVLTSGDECISVEQETAVFSDIAVNSTGSNLTNRFVFSVGDETPYHRAPFDLSIYSDGDQYNNTINFEIEIGREDILLIDDDGQDALEDYFTDAADLAHLSCKYHGRVTQGSPDTALWGDYSTVLWFTGSQRDSTLTLPDQEWLGTFLDRGGNLFITGQNIASDLRESPFLNEYLHAQFVADSSTDAWLRGEPGDPITGDYNLLSLIDGPNGAGNQTSPDVIQPTNGASSILSYFNTGQSAALRYRGNYNIVFFAIGLESIINFYDAGDSDVTRADLLQHIYYWLQFQPHIGDVNEDGVINVLDIVQVVNIILKTIPEPTDYQLWAADFNGNGEVNILDVVGIVNVILGGNQARQ
jgi:hypothetical protein